MAILPIVTYQDPVLSRKADPVTDIGPEFTAFIQDMFDTMYEADGVGLAAPQVGRSIRVFVIDADVMMDDDEPGLRLGPTVFINPEVVWSSEETVKHEEGCLSLPTLRDEVTRPARIRLQYQDESLQPRELELDGWNARVVLHELDHLDGILFIERISPFRRTLHRSLLSRIEKGDVSADYPLAPKR